MRGVENLQGCGRLNPTQLPHASKRVQDEKFSFNDVLVWFDLLKFWLNDNQLKPWLQKRSK